jgi:hypothetical protein
VLGAVLAAIGLWSLASGTAPPATTAPEWVFVEYGDLVARRQLSHSGESVGQLLSRLEGRPLPPPGERPADFHAHRLLEPLLEPYAFVLSDALDTLGAVPAAPWVEVGSLWQAGERQPAWVELLRARRLVVESDGAGRLRAILPWFPSPGAAAGGEEDSRTAARAAWQDAWPVLRHVLAAESRRLAANGSEPPALDVAVYAYRHLPERSEFRLGTSPERFTLDDLRPAGTRPPLELDRMRAFLENGLRLEGARLGQEGSLELFGSPAEHPPTLLDRPVRLEDLAVAYRAVFHGGLTRPYMSLDRGYSPSRSVVNYGGRLRDTALGMVSLLCDIRFKTFSQGIDIAEGIDLRERLRERIPSFRTHLEALAAHPESRGIEGQQTRLWFYPDAVDLTLSEPGDVMVLRRVRMSAASERVGESGVAAGEDVRPWTRATVEAINREYDALATFFPEMADLDEVVRLLSLFAWLEAVADEGHLLPDLESLLALELPAFSTPRTYPQLLAFNALPPSGEDAGVAVYDRVAVGEALERLGPLNGRPFPARRRYERALRALDPQRPEHAALLEQLRRYDPQRLDDTGLDLLAHRAERVRMHETVLGTLEAERRREVTGRLEAGEKLRMFSVGIGGLDLDMGPVVERARGRSLALGDGVGGRVPEPSSGVAPGPATAQGRSEAAWRRDPEMLPETRMPDHGAGDSAGARGATREHGHHRVEVGSTAAGESGREPTAWVLTVYGADGPEPRSRRLFLDGDRRILSFERVENGRRLRYHFDRRGERLTAVRLAEERTTSGAAAAAPAALPAGLALLQVDEPGNGRVESTEIGLRLESRVEGSRRNLEAAFPRPLLQRLVLGREIDRTPGQPLPGLSPLPSGLGAVHTVMVLPPGERWLSPWEREPVLAAGEEDPIRLARALGAWWSGEGAGAPAAVVGVDPVRSPERWETAPRPGPDALLLLPDGAFGTSGDAWRTALAAEWDSARVASSLPDAVSPALVVLVSTEPPASFGLRLRRLARDPRMRGRLLAAWSLGGPVRADLARSWIDEGQLAGIGLAEHSLVARRGAARALGELRRALASGGAEPPRIERIGGPFLWHF